MSAGIIQRQLNGSLTTVGFYILRCTTLVRDIAVGGAVIPR